MDITLTKDNGEARLNISHKFELETRTIEPLCAEIKTSKLFTKPVYGWLSEEDVIKTPGEPTFSIRQQIGGGETSSISIPVDKVDEFINELIKLKSVYHDYSSKISGC